MKAIAPKAMPTPTHRYTTYWRRPESRIFKSILKSGITVLSYMRPSAVSGDSTSLFVGTFFQEVVYGCTERSFDGVVSGSSKLIMSPRKAPATTPPAMRKKIMTPFSSLPPLHFD